MAVFSETKSSETSGAGYSYPDDVAHASLNPLTRPTQRARAYLTNHEALDTPLYGRDQLGCNCFSAGEPTFTENIMPRAYKSMLAYFQLVNDVPGYYETEVLPEADNSDKDVAGQGELQEGNLPESPRAA